MCLVNGRYRMDDFAVRLTKNRALNELIRFEEIVNNGTAPTFALKIYLCIVKFL